MVTGEDQPQPPRLTGDALTESALERSLLRLESLLVIARYVYTALGLTFLLWEMFEIFWHGEPLTFAVVAEVSLVSGLTPALAWFTHRWGKRLVTVARVSYRTSQEEIRDRRRAEQALQQSESRFRALVEGSLQGTFVHKEFIIQFANEAAARIYGYSDPAKLVGQDVRLLVAPQQRDLVLGNASARLRGKPVASRYEFEAVRKDGARIWVEILASVVEWDAEPAILTSVFDITSRRQADDALRRAHSELERRVAERTMELTTVNEQLEQEISERRHAEEAVLLAKEEADRANLAKSEFLSRMSHELRTPMNAILGFAQLLEMDTLAPVHREGVEHILKGGQYLLELINEVLDISRIEAGRMALSLEPVSMSQILEETLSLVAPLAREKGICLQQRLPSGPDSHILADHQRLTQVLLNLLSNAVKYNREGGTVTVACEERPGTRMRIQVIDTGHGIAPDKIGRLFTAFERLGAEATDTEGTGLGLALAKRLTELMSGTLGVESVVGQGSIFWVELPFVPSPLEELTQAAENEPGQRWEAGGPRCILYIEDNLANLKLVEQVLARRPQIKLLAAMQGSLGLDLAREHGPDLILLDLNLADIPGHELLRRLREDPRTHGIPIVVISADATSRQMEQLVAAGAEAYLTKPLNIQHFLELLDKILTRDAR